MIVTTLTHSASSFSLPLTLGDLEQQVVSNEAVKRLLVACALGSLVGVEREWKGQSAGIRTNLLICLACAFFTLMSPILAGDNGSNKGQIAANIVQGIGFLGAGLILHNRDRVSGLTSAATVWAVASIGMACGAGLYGPAMMSAVLVIVVLEVVGILEREGNLKSYTVVYEVRGIDAGQMKMALLDAMDHVKRQLSEIDDYSVGEMRRLSFEVVATSRVHKRLLAEFKNTQAIGEVLTFRSQEDE